MFKIGKLYRNKLKTLITGGISIPEDAIFCLLSYHNDLEMVPDDDWMNPETCVRSSCPSLREQNILYLKILYNGKVYNPNFSNPNDIAFCYFEEVGT